MRRFDQLARFAPDMVATESQKVWRFMKGLRGDLVKFVDTGKEGPETYADAIERAIRIEAWDGPAKRFSAIEEKKDVAE